MSTTTDPRPLTQEPMGVDLLNTIWRDAAGEHDLLADLDGLRLWLAARGLGATAPVTEDARVVLVGAREALRRHVAGVLTPPAPPAARAELNALLARGAFHRALEDDGPATRAVVPDPTVLAAWTAVEDYLRLLERDSTRLRACAGPGCVLHFVDRSRRGDRRWCSMAGCGNRAKAARHHARRRTD